jgi:hypothetical protein
MGEKRNACRTLVEDHQEDQEVGGDNIKMGPRGTEWGAIDWSDVVQDRDQWRPLVNTVMNLQVP